MPEARDVLLGKIPRTYRVSECDDSRKNLPGEPDVEYYSLHYFLNLAAQGQTGAVDMLFTPDNMTYLDPQYGWIWKDIVRNRKLLLSKQMNAFTGYARGQAAKYSLKGERLHKLELFRDALSAHITSFGIFVTLARGWDLLPKDDERINPQGIRELQIAGKWYGETTAMQIVMESIYKQIDAYGKRTHAAADAGGVDWKALSHAVRVTKELSELLTLGEIQFPLRDCQLLLDIKQGKLSLEEVQGIIDRDLAFAELQAQESSLPETVDRAFWDRFLMWVTANDIVQTFEHDRP